MTTTSCDRHSWSTWVKTRTHHEQTCRLCGKVKRIRLSGKPEDHSESYPFHTPKSDALNHRKGGGRRRGIRTTDPRAEAPVTVRQMTEEDRARVFGPSTN